MDKKKFSLLLGMVMTFSSVSATSLDINVGNAGSLRSLLADKTVGLTGLTLSGNLNGDDILYLRELSGTTIEGDETEDGILEMLDMKNARIVAGGGPYYSFYWDEYETEDDIIGAYMFYGCRTLKRVVLPDDVTAIGDNAFDTAKSLTGIVIGDKVESIGEMAFNDAGLSSIVLPESVAELGDMAFYNCQNLETARLSDNIRKINYGTFYYCVSLKEVNVPLRAESIGINAFHYCSALEKLEIPASMEKISDSAFGMCLSITEFVVNENNSFYTDVEGVLYDKAVTKIYKYPIGRPEDDYSLPATVTTIMRGAFEESRLHTVIIGYGVNEIGESAFFNCKQLENVTLSSSLSSLPRQCFFGCNSLKTIEFPASVSELGESAFMTSGLEKVKVPEGVSKIPEGCFYGCENLAEVEISESVRMIDYIAFYNCKSLMTINCHGSEPAKCYDSGVFTGVDKSACVLNVPASAVERYAASDVWKDFNNIRGLDFSGISRMNGAVGIYETDRYSLDGKKLMSPQPGINIVRYSDGTVGKEMVR